MSRARIAIASFLPLVIACTQPGSTTPGQGNLTVYWPDPKLNQTDSWTWTEFDPVTEPLLVNKGIALLAPPATTPLSGESVLYSDTWSSNWAPTEILVGIRDPAEYLTTLESCLGSQGNGCFTNNTIGPGGIGNAHGWEGSADVNANADQNTGIDVPISDPGMIGFLYPQYGDAGAGFDTPGSITESILMNGFTPSEFTGPGNTSSVTSVASGGIHAVYVGEHGACSVNVPLQPIIDKIVNTGSNQLVSSLESVNLPWYLGGYPAFGIVTAQVFASSWFGINGNEQGTNQGGFVTEIDLQAPTVSVIDVGDVDIGKNDTFTFTLNDGILGVTDNENGSYDQNDNYGAIGTLRNKYAPGVESSIAQQAITQQSRPIPSIGANPDECTGDHKPASCFFTCNDNGVKANKDSQDAGAYDDPTWYNTRYCDIPAAALANYAWQAAAAYQISLPTSAPPGAQYPQNYLTPMLDTTSSNNQTYYENFRCNFNPSYTTTSPGTGVCEVIARISRLNVMPDEAEAVLFDGAGLSPAAIQSMDESTYSLEAFQLFLGELGSKLPANNGSTPPTDDVIQGAANSVCTYQTQTLASYPVVTNSSTPNTLHAFAHGNAQL